MQVLLEVKNVYYSSKEKEILKGVNLQVMKGEIHSVIGVNGTGKTTLAAVIMGLHGYEPNEGRIIFKGKDITSYPINKRAEEGITLAWQNPAVFEGITVRDYLSINSKVKPEELLKKVGLNPEQYLERNVDDNLSGGERKRIELASVMGMNPELVILDEPDSGIDLAFIEVIKKIIKDFKKQGTSVLLITHNEKMAEIGDVVSLMCEGKIIKQDKPENVASFFRENCSKCLHVGKIREEKLNG